MKVLVANPATRESISETKERFFIKAGSRWPWSLEKKKSEKNTACFFPFYLAYTANLLIAFMKLYRKMSPKIKFEKAFADGRIHL